MERCIYCGREIEESNAAEVEDGVFICAGCAEKYSDSSTVADTLQKTVRYQPPKDEGGDYGEHPTASLLKGCAKAIWAVGGLLIAMYVVIVSIYLDDMDISGGFIAVLSSCVGWAFSVFLYGLIVFAIGEIISLLDDIRRNTRR